MKYKLSNNAPENEEDLIKRAFSLTGKKIVELCEPFNKFFNEKSKKSKGYLGKILEMYLGASAGNLPIPDFPNLKIELKILPLNKNMLPKSNVKICYNSNMPTQSNYKWDSSIVKLKLNKVLWIPIEADSSIPLRERRICHPFLSHLKDYENIIKEDYKNITYFLFSGKMEYISANLGKYLILQSISSNKNLTNYFNFDGDLIRTNFKAFYLKKNYLRKIIYENLHL